LIKNFNLFLKVNKLQFKIYTKNSNN
jgi:hypothetical protein